MFAKVISDRLLLTASIVTASGWTLGKERLCPMVRKIISTVSKVPEDDLDMVSSCIINVIIKKSKYVKF